MKPAEEHRVTSCSGTSTHSDLQSVRFTGRRLKNRAFVEDKDLERRRRAIMCAYATCTGLLTPPYPPPKCLERTVRRVPSGDGALRLRQQLHGRIGLPSANGIQPPTRALLATPTGHSPAVKTALAKANLEMLPRCHTFVEFKHRLMPVSGVQSMAISQRQPLHHVGTHHSVACALGMEAGASADVMVVAEDPDDVKTCSGQQCEPGTSSLDPAVDSVTQVNISHVSEPELKDPMRFDSNSQ